MSEDRKRSAPDVAENERKRSHTDARAAMPAVGAIRYLMSSSFTSKLNSKQRDKVEKITGELETFIKKHFGLTDQDIYLMKAVCRVPSKTPKTVKKGLEWVSNELDDIQEDHVFGAFAELTGSEIKEAIHKYGGKKKSSDYDSDRCW